MKQYRTRQGFYKQAHWSNVVRKQVLYNFNYRCARCDADL